MQSTFHQKKYAIHQGEQQSVSMRSKHISQYHENNKRNQAEEMLMHILKSTD